MQDGIPTLCTVFLSKLKLASLAALHMTVHLATSKCTPTAEVDADKVNCTPNIAAQSIRVYSTILMLCKTQLSVHGSYTSMRLVHDDEKYSIHVQARAATKHTKYETKQNKTKKNSNIILVSHEY